MVMADLVLGVAIVAGFSLALYRTGRAVARRRSVAVANGLAIATLALTLVYALSMHGTLTMAKILPWSNALVVGNWIPLGAMLLAGLADGQVETAGRRRPLVCLLLVAMAWTAVLRDLIGSPPPVEAPLYHEGICMQTNRATCSACSAAEILRQCGIHASEREMTRLCLTRRHGTPALGLYRGLKLKTRGTGWQVEVIHATWEELQRQASWPVLLQVRADRNKLAGLQGGLARMDHTIVVLGLLPTGKIDVADPAAGHKPWTIDELKSRWAGDGLRLIRR
jgi:hypothetical protein